MTKTKPTDEAMRAAVSVRTDIMASVATAEEHDQVAAIIIDAETHLPELLAVVEAARDVVGDGHGRLCSSLRVSPTGDEYVSAESECDCCMPELRDALDALAALDEAKMMDR